MAERDERATSRRRFLAGAGTAAFTFSIVRPEVAFGTAASSKIRLGMIGCGSRGTRVGGHFRDHGGFELWAAADYFPEQAIAWGERYGVPPNRRFSGLAAYRKLLESGVDAVAIESPPYFHPEQAAAAVDAGKHVYLAKPIAVDAPGCRTVAESGAAATARKRVFLVDFQTRADALYIEALRRVHAGEIGDLVFGEATYHAGCPWVRQFAHLERAPRDPEARLRAWGLDRILSGDIITEQNIHTLDVASWILGTPPLFADGTGGRKVRRDLGNVWDHFTVLFQYPNGVGVTFSSRQFEGHGSPGGINNRMFGTKGVLETQYGGAVLIRGEKPYPGGTCPKIYNQGIIDNIRTFHRSIVDGACENPTVARSVRSNLVTILGRTAAYRGERYHWHQLLKNEERLEHDMEGLRV